MSAITNPTQEFTTQPAPYTISVHVRRGITVLLVAVALVCISAIVAAGSLIAYGRLQHGDTIFSGVTATGVDLSGKSPEVATSQLQQRFDTFMSSPVQFTTGDRSFTATPAELGITLDAQATAARAYNFGRSENLWRESRNWLDAWSGGHIVNPVMRVNSEQFREVVASEAEAFAVAPQDATLVHHSDGTIGIDPGHAGVAINVEKTYESFMRQMRTLSTGTVAIATVTVPQEVEQDQLGDVLTAAQAIAGKPLQLTLNGTVWQVPSDDLFAALRVTTEDGTSTVGVDRIAIRAIVASLESTVFTPGVNADIRNDHGTFTVIPAESGHKLDIDASTEAVLAALDAGNPSAALVTTPVAPNVTDADAQLAKTTAQRLTAQPLILTWDNGTAKLETSQLAAAVRFSINSARNPKITVSFDNDLMAKFLAPVAEQVKVNGHNADLRWIDGTVRVQTPEVAGRGLDVEATVKSLQRAVEQGTTNVAVVTMEVKPQVTSDMAAGIQIKDKLAQSATEYGSSSPSRLHNVELAASRLNGAMVPPGGTFSFNDAIGAVTYDSGYQTGYGIVITNGSISTVPSVGGGICQVATTMFQSAFWAGMPITQRSWHLYWIPRYGQPPSGMTGLDATVDPDYNLDFQFKNGSNNWIAVKAFYDGATLRVELWGTSTGWQVTADPPVITNIVPASSEMYYEKSSELPAGTSVFVEEAQDGFDAAIHRVVKNGDQVIDDTVFHSTYAPARNTTLIGTGT